MNKTKKNINFEGAGTEEWIEATKDVEISACSFDFGNEDAFIQSTERARFFDLLDKSSRPISAKEG